MLFKYKALTNDGKEKRGDIEAANQDQAVSALQRRGLIVVSVIDTEQKSLLKRRIPFFDRVPLKDVVIMSRQIATLFEAQVPAAKIFTLLAESSDNPILRHILAEVTQDIQAGVTVSDAMAKHPQVFSNFYVNMVRAGEESGKMTDTFTYLADYLERAHELTSKTRNALVYPFFVVLTFIIVVILMLTLVIPRLSQILLESGGDIPIYTKVVIVLSDFFVDWGIFLLLLILVGGFVMWRYSRGKKGRLRIDSMKISIPYFGDLYRKLYLSRISDNLDTMLSAGIPVIRAIEITGQVVDNQVYKNIMDDTLEQVKSGSPLSEAFKRHKEMPPVLVQMVQVGEESGSVGPVLKTLARFYKRAVDNAVDTLIGLIEPAMIVVLGLAVGFLLTSILVPIYNIATNIA